MTKEVKAELIAVLAQISDGELDVTLKEALLESRTTRASVRRRNSLRLRKTVQPQEGSSEEQEPESEDTDADEPAPVAVIRLSAKPDPHKARVKKLTAMLHPEKAVGEKRKRALNDVTWNDIREAYEVDCKKLKFIPTKVALPKKDLASLVAQVEKRERYNDEEPLSWNEGTVKSLVDDVLMAAGDATNKGFYKIQTEEYLDNEELGVGGRADMVMKERKGTREFIVIECKGKGGSMEQGLAQMMLAAETLLAKKLESNEAPDECVVYGLVAHCCVWQWVRLDRKEGRFHRTMVDADNFVSCMTDMASIAHGILRNEPITLLEEHVVNSDKRARYY